MKDFNWMKKKIFEIIMVSLIMLSLTFLYSSIYSEEEKVILMYDEFIQEGNIKTSILKVVKDYIKTQVNKAGFLAVMDTLTNKERKFKVVEILDVVSRKGVVYTVQVDVDEVRGEPPYILFFDVEEQNGEFKLIKIRIDGRHLRQKWEGEK